MAVLGSHLRKVKIHLKGNVYLRLYNNISLMLTNKHKGHISMNSVTKKQHVVLIDGHIKGLNSITIKYKD